MHLNNDKTRGTAAAFGAYVIWGFLVLYWKLIDDIPPLDVICYRIVWTPAFMLALFLAASVPRRIFIGEIKGFFRNPSQMLRMFAASVLISLNWLTYLFAVNNNHVAEASLGYFINPLINFLLSILFLRERLSRAGIAACVFALAGVVTAGIQAGVVPWISLTLALTFAFYGLIKIKINLRAYTSLTVETLTVLPLALIYQIGFADTSFMGYGTTENLLVIGAGVVTAVPLLMFADAVPRISYISMGFIQYISPSITFFLSVFVFREPIPPMKLLGFVLIWLGILIFCVDNVRTARNGAAQNKNG
jgi:chloramphenicol-sensitive protein RarD